MKKYLSLFLAVLMVFALCACAADKPAESAAPDASAPVEEAAARLTYERDRKIMRDAYAHILKYHAK